MIPLPLHDSVELPDSLTVTCRANGVPQSGLLIGVSLRMSKKNDYHCLFGPSDSSGEIHVRKDELRAEIDHSLELFPTDYEPLESFEGDVEVEPLGLPAIEAALRAFDLYHAVSPYPPGYRSKLETAWTALYHSAPKRLDVEVLVQLAATVSVPPPIGRSLRIQTRSVTT